MMRATARLISINSYYQESYWLIEHKTLCTCFDSRFRVHIYIYISNIKKTECGCVFFSCNGLVEMKKTKCLQEITTIHYKWNIILVSRALVDILFRWTNIISLYFSFCLHLYIYSYIVWCQPSCNAINHIFSGFFFCCLSSMKSEVHHRIIIEIVFSQ